jgi:hypothetical protein
MKRSVKNIGNGTAMRLFKALCLVVAFVTGLCGDVWGATYTMRDGDYDWNGYAWSRWYEITPTSADEINVDRRGRILTINISDAQCDDFNFLSGTVDIPSEKSLTIGGNLDIRGNNTTLNVDGTVTINSITSTTNPKITGSGTIIINTGEFKCDLSRFTGTLRITNLSNQWCSENSSCNVIITNYTATTSVSGGIYTNLTVNGDVDLCGDVTVTGSLTWNNYRIKLGGHSFTLDKNATIISTSDFDDSHYFVFPHQATAGFVVFKGDLSRLDDNVVDGGVIIPVGNVNGSAYTYRPVEIEAITTSESSFSVRSTNKSGTNRDNDLKCYWTTESENISNAKLTFSYRPVDVEGIPASVVLYPFCNPGTDWEKWVKDGSEWKKDDKQIVFTQCTPIGQWTACENITSFYSYGNGDWSNSNIWTLDPSGTMYKNPNGLVPGEANRVIIKAGNEVRAEADGKKALSLTIENGGVLSLETTVGHNFGQVKGQGKLALATTTFPGGDFSVFVRENGGIVEYQNAVDFKLPTDREIYNNLIINIPTGKTARLGSDFKVNGYLKVQSGTFQIGDETGNGWTILIEGDVIVETGAAITTSSTPVSSIGEGHRYYDVDRDIMGHYMVINGDLINNGSVKFTNLSPAEAPTYYGIMPNSDYEDSARDHVDVFFKNQTKDQNVVINGPTYFYMIDVDKGGRDQCVNISASAKEQFFLLGYLWNFPENIDGSVHADQYNKYYHALRLSKGTLRLGENIKIEALQFPQWGSNRIFYNSYLIPETGCLWIDGAEVNVGYTNGIYQTTTFAVYGKLKMTNSKSVLNTNCTNGILWREYGVIEIEDGTINTQSISTSIGSGGVAHRGSFVMRGGTLNLVGKSLNLNLPVFGMTHTTMSLLMSGGDVNITTNNNARVALAIGIDENNATITGGAFNITTNGNTSTFTSTVPFYDLSIKGGYETQVSQFTAPYNGGAANVAVKPVNVLNNLTIENTGHLNTNNNDVTIGGDFTIASSCQYTPGTNTTTFNGTARTVEFTAIGTINGNGLNNLTIDEGTSLVLNNDVAVRSNLSLKANSTFVDNGNTLSVSGNIENNGTQYNSGSAAGSITLAGDADQTISGNGEGAFNNLHINKSGGSVALSADIKVTGALRMLSNHNLNIGSYNLNLDDNDAAIYSDASTGTDFSNTKMIVTTGLSSDGGITKRYSSTQPFLFPYGYSTYYLPASIQVANNPAAFGTVTSRPVSGIHFAFGGNTNALGCYWRNTSNGFEGVTDVIHKYTYVDGVVNGIEAYDIMPGCYNMSGWEYIQNSSLVDKGNNQITYPGIKIDGDYTCGTEAALTNSPQTLYSATALGDWEDASSWSAVGVGEAGGGNGTPGAGTIVYIGDKTHPHTIRMSDNIEHKSGVLCIAKNSTLDLGATDRNNFGMVSGEANGGGGTVRLSSINFPGGDFGEFLRAGGGTIEYYTNGGDIAIPALPTTYNNLKITASGNNYCTLPNIDLHVYGDLTSSGGTNTYYNRFNIGNNTRTLTIDGDLFVETGNLKFQSSTTRSGGGWGGYTYTNYPQNVIVKGNVKVDNGASFGVINSNYDRTFVNQITIYGNMVSDGTISFAPDNQKVATTFMGTANDTIKGSGTISLYTLTCDKGTDATPVLYIEKNISTSGSTSFLTLLNGTFRANGGDVNINLTTNSDFTVPATACLSTQKGTFTVCNSSNGNAKLILNGKLEVLGGKLNIGDENNHYGNDIEYNIGTIEIGEGVGILNVSGQIRRAITLQTGDLTYIQSGGFVNIYGGNRDSEYSDGSYTERNTLQRRALFEVCNNGSFTMSGGELCIHDNAKGDGWSEYGFGDILITPAAYNVTGGTLIVGGGAAAAGQTFLFNSSADIFNLTIGAVDHGQNLKLQVNPLNLLGKLTINENSMLQAVGHNVFVKGDIDDNSTNGYSASDGQCLTLNGTSLQRITGTGVDGNNVNKINVNKITFSNPSKVELSGINIEAANYIYIERGTVDDGNNLIIAKSDVINDSYHISSGADGGIRTEGTTAVLRSTSGHIGNYGNLIIRNQTAADDNFIVNGKLTLENVLNIGSIQLTMGPDATFDGSFGSNSMVQLTGAIGDLGVKCMLPNDSRPLLFPVGRTGIYSPAQYTFTNVTGTDPYIVVKVIGYRHKSMKEVPEGSVDMYWMVSSGGINGGTVTHEYIYDDEDLKAGTDESKLLAKRYLAVENEWTNYDNDESSVSNNIITINSLSYVDGEYTAGYYGYSCQPPMRSRITGPWNLSSTWEELVDKANDIWALTNSTPNGNPVTITSGTTVTVGEDSHAAYSTDIEGVLNIGNTSKHNFGRVRGSGTLELKALESAGDMQSTFKLPAGDYEEFLADANSTIIFDNGDRNAWLGEQPGNLYKPFSNVEFKGEGKTTVTAQAFSARGDVTIIDGCQIDNATNNRPFYVGGNYIDQNTSKTGYIKGSSKVIFCGTQPQTVTLGYDASFYDMEINNSAGVSVLGNDIDVSNKLYLTDGVIHTTAEALVRLSSTNINAVTGGSAASHIDGPMSKNVLNSGSFAFPVGNYGRYGQITISNTAGTGYWTAQYFNTDPSVLGTTYAPPVETICDNEYWTVGRPAGATAKIGLRWDAESTPYTDIDMLKNRMQIVEYGNSIWTALESDAEGTLASGTITTNANVTQDDYKFTFGYTGVVADITNTDGIEICGDGQTVAEVNVSLSGTAPWTLSYRVSDGTTSFDRTQSGILRSPYTISLLSTDLGDAGTYTVSLLGVSDATSDGVTTEHTASIVVKQTYIPVITGPQAIVNGEDRTFSVENHAGSQYSWSITGPQTSIRSGQGSSSVVIRSTNNGTHTLSVTETANGCSVEATLDITVSDNPAPDFDANLNVCVDDEATYATGYASEHTYQWALNGTNITTDAENNYSLTYTWTTPGTYTLKVTETKTVVNYGRTYIYKGSKEKTITVHPKPAVQTIAKIDEICAGEKPIVTLNGSEQGVSYYLYSGDNAISSLVSGTGSAINLTTLDALTQNTNIYVAATNLGCNFEQSNYQRIPVQIASPNTVTITVHPSPAITYTMPALYIDAPSILDYEVEANGAVLDNYLIDYTTGGVDAAGILPDANIEFKPTASHIAGTLTIASDKGCSTSYDFDADASDGYVWEGSESNAWGDSRNWYSGAIPTNGHDAVIRNGNYLPVISNAAEAKSVKIESGVLTISGANRLDVYGDWQNEVGNAGFVGSESTVAFNNDAVISGNTTFGSIGIENGSTVNINEGYIVVEGSIDNDGTLSGSSGTTLELGGTTDGATLSEGIYNLANLTINKTAGSITSSADLNVSGALSVNAGVIYMGNNKINLGINATAESSDPSAYVEGTMTKKGASAVTFPIGNGRRAMVGIAPSGAPVSSVYTASYLYTPKNSIAQPTEPDPMDADLKRVSKMDKWELTGTASAYVTLYWDDGSVSEITQIESLTIAHWNGSKWEMLAATATGDPASGQIKTKSPVSSFSPFTFGSTSVDENPLPIEIASFTGKQTGNAVVLEWTTMSEKDNDYFEIERSIDGINFVTIGRIDGAGDSTGKLTYNFVDNQPEQTVTYYRLLQVDFDGARSYADKIISVVYTIDSNVSLTVVPNPTRGMFEVRIVGAANGKAKLLTQSGKPIRIIDIRNFTESIDISDLPSGIYILQYQSGENVVHERVVKL